MDDCRGKGVLPCVHEGTVVVRGRLKGGGRKRRVREDDDYDFESGASTST